MAKQPDPIGFVPVPLESILRTEALKLRPARPADYQKQVAIAGVLKQHIGGGTPRDLGPCGLGKGATFDFTLPSDAATAGA
jgi:hypothetical protein